jgi:hypothetical protein
MTICALSPRYRCATVAYSTRDWNASLPRMADIVSTRKRETMPEIAPKTRNASVGLYNT